MAVSVHQQCWSWWRGEDSARPVTRPVSRQPQWCDAVLRGLGYGLLGMLAVSPSGGLVVAGTRPQAPVEVSDETVRKRAERLVVERAESRRALVLRRR